MLRFPCLVLDHDDTVVQSTPTVNYPAFLKSLHVLRPGLEMPPEEFLRLTYSPGFFPLCTDLLHYTASELAYQAQVWKEFARSHVPAAVPGIGGVLRRHRAAGGRIYVVSHSAEELILRDYQALFSLQPDGVFSCDLPEDCWKPSPYALHAILRECGLSPGQLLVLDDLRPGCDMAHACSVPFAAAAWGGQPPEILADLRRRSEYYFQSPAALSQVLFD